LPARDGDARPSPFRRRLNVKATAERWCALPCLAAAGTAAVGPHLGAAARRTLPCVAAKCLAAGGGKRFHEIPALRREARGRADRPAPTDS
jgi:hypothetical protein